MNDELMLYALLADPDVIQVRLVRLLTIGVAVPLIEVTRYAVRSNGQHFDDQYGRATTVSWERLPKVKPRVVAAEVEVSEPDPVPAPPVRQWVRPRLGSQHPAHPYRVGSQVMHNGQAYVSELDDNVREPPSGWRLIGS